MIPGVDFHPIESWQESGRYQMSGPGFPNPGDIIVVYIHYPGGGTAPTTVAQMDARMRSMQRSYIDDRGYSLGYGFVIPPFGGVWEGRGVRFRNAANAGKKVAGNANYWSVSIQMNVTGASAATDTAIQDAARVIEWLRNSGMMVVIGWHAQVDWTSCAGSGVIPQVQAGMFEPEYWTEPEPEPEPEPIPENDMTPLIMTPSPQAQDQHDNPPWFYKNEHGAWHYCDADTNAQHSAAYPDEVRQIVGLDDQYRLVHGEVFGYVWPT